MQLTYDDIGVLPEVTLHEPAAAHWTDRAPAELPLLGFLLASVISGVLWGLIAVMTWVLLA